MLLGGEMRDALLVDVAPDLGLRDRQQAQREQHSRPAAR